MSPRANVVIPAVVATAVVLAAVAEGGYSVEAVAAIAILAWTAVLSGLASGVFPRSRLPDAAVMTGALLVALTLLTGISIAWASDDGIAVQELVKVSAYLGLFALVACASREGELRSWLTGLAIGIVAVGAVALLSRTIPALPGGDQEINEFLPAARGRLSFPIGYWNGLAALLALGIVLLTGFSAIGRSRAVRAAATGAVPMLGLCIYLASSRGGFAAAILGLLLLLALGPRRRTLLASVVLTGLGTGLLIAIARSQSDLLNASTDSAARSQGVELLVATIVCTLLIAGLRALLDDRLGRLSPIEIPRPRLVIAACALLVLVAVVAANPVQRFDDFKKLPSSAGGNDFVASHLSSGSGSGRWQFWQEAADAFGSDPVHGVGAGGYRYYWTQHAPIDQTVTHAHSLYLQQLAELGPVALLALLALLAIGPLRALADRAAFTERGALAIAATIVLTGAFSAAIDWSWDIPVVFAPVIVALALLCGPAPRSAARDALPGDHPEAARRRGSRGWRMALAVIGLLCLVIAVDSLLAERSLTSSRDAASSGDLSRAGNDARNAIALQPWAAAPRLQLALVQETAGDLQAADGTIREAISRAPDDWELWLARSRIALLSSDVPEARTAFEHARSLNPRDPVFTGLPGPLQQ